MLFRWTQSFRPCRALCHHRQISTNICATHGRRFVCWGGDLSDDLTVPALHAQIKAIQGLRDIDTNINTYINHFNSVTSTTHSSKGDAINASQTVNITGLNTAGQIGSGATSDWDSDIIKFDVSKEKLIGAAIGRDHIILGVQSYSENKDYLLVSGSNQFSQLLTPARLYFEDDTNSLRPTIRRRRKLELPSTGHITHLEAGLDHTILVLNGKDVYSSGWSCDGQTGQGTLSSSVGVGRVIFSESEELTVNKLVCGADFTLLLSDNHQVYTWGNSEYGQCMHGFKQDQVPKPFRVPLQKYLLPGERVVDVAATATSSFLLTDLSNIYAAGFGILGLGEGIIESLTPTRIPFFGVNKDGRVIGTDRINVLKGGPHNVLMAGENSVYSFGLSSNTSRLGIATSVDQQSREALDSSTPPSTFANVFVPTPILHLCPGANCDRMTDAIDSSPGLQETFAESRTGWKVESLALGTDLSAIVLKALE